MALIPESSVKIRVIDSHTAGEPTRVVVSGVAEPAGECMTEKRSHFARDLDWLRSSVVCEPRGHEAMVGAMLCKPGNPDCVAGVIFFNNVGVLNGCLHGTMGLAVTLMHLGRIGPGEHQIETPTGVVTVSVADSGKVTVSNVRSYRARTEVEIEIPGFAPVTGDVSWGGNWFFLADAPNGLAVDVRNIDVLTDFSWRLRRRLCELKITGDDGGEIDHIELFGPPADLHTADSKNFVLCPGKAFDRSPCGTGTSAKLACLDADGKLNEGEVWRQAGILDTIFEGAIKPAPEGGVFPTVTGSAHITAEAELLIDPSAPFAFGIPPFISKTNSN